MSTGAGDRIKALRLSKNMSQEQLGDLIGKGRAAIHKYESGIVVNLKISTIKALAEALNVSPIDIMGYSAPVFARIPANSTLESLDVLEYEELYPDDKSSNSKFFALKISGDDMEPEYRQDDIAIFRKTDTFEDGKCCAVMVGSEDATFKKIITQAGGILIQPLNSNYEPQFYSNEDVANLPIRIIGVFEELRRRK